MKYSHALLSLLASLGMLAASSHAQAQIQTQTQAQTTWPTKAVRLLVPAPAGSSLDIVARLLSEKLMPVWGQTVIVDNKPGAGGMLGTDIAAKATDQHTMVISFNGPIAFGPSLYKKMPYDPAKDLVAIVETTAQPNVLAVSASLPVNTIKEFIVYAKANPGKLNYASIGNGSSSHLTMELFKSQAGFTATHVPFNGSPPAALSLANGDTQALFAVASGIAPMVKAGKVKLLAVSSIKRFDQMPTLPSIAESAGKGDGFKAFEALAWNGLFMAASTPEYIVAKVNRDVNAALNTTDIKARLYVQGMQVSQSTPASFAKTIAEDAKNWGLLIQTLGFKLD